MAVQTKVARRGSAARVASLRRASVPISVDAVRTVGHVARETGSVVGAGLDGLLVGFVLGYILAVLISGPAKYLGMPSVVEAAIAGAGAAAIAVLGAVVAEAIRRLVSWFGDRLDLALAGWADGGLIRSRIRRVVAIPFRVVRGSPAPWLGALVSILLLANVAANVGPFGLFIPAGALGPYVVLGAVVACLGAAAVRVARRAGEPGVRALRWSRLGTTRRAVAAGLAGLAILVAGGGASVLVAPGSVESLVTPELVLDGFSGGRAGGLEDPGAPGPYRVRATSYGSGTDRHRPAFGRDATATTPTVDASKVLAPLGWGADEARAAFWGFDSAALPLNGLVWIPDGDGPFPLVLIVHGNHAMGSFSEPGYAYLGEHLASRGMIAVSVDEDFLNGSWASDWGGREQLVRAWFLLLHLDQWRTWTADATSPFHGLVDLDRIALIGHSRGGEAASVAASLARRDTPPDPDIARWPTGLRARAVVSIAPSDGQYATGPVVLRDVDFLTLQGGHDSDASSWMGIRQYARTVVEGAHFKAALWSYRSNHGQFNSVWGRSDHGPLGGAILNLAPLLGQGEQEDVARTAIGAFLEASLHGRAGYRDFFRRPMVGRDWLPADDIYLVRSGDGDFLALTTGDPAQGREGTTVTATGFETVRSRALPLRTLLPDQGTVGVELHWTAEGGVASWAVHGIETSAAVARPVAIRFALANGATEKGDDEPMRIQVELATTDGVRVALPLAQWGTLPPGLPVQLAKNDFVASLAAMDLAQGAPIERVLQTYELPLTDFVGAEPSLDPARLSAIRLIVDRSTAGSLWLSEVGLVPGG